MNPITRQDIDAAIAREEWGVASALLKQFFWSAPSLAAVPFVCDRMPKIPDGTPRVAARLAVLRSFTLEPALSLLRAAAMLHGVDLTMQVGDFNTYPQEMLDPQSSLYRFDPQMVLLAVQTRDLLPEIWNHAAQLTPTEAHQIAERALNDLGAWIGAFRSRSQAHLILHTLEVPAFPNAGILDGQTSQGQLETIREFNRHLGCLAREGSGVYLLDYDGLVARHGRTRWHDERKWLTARMPFTAESLFPMAQEWLKLVLPLTGRTARAVVVDLDNTLWGGVIGEDGMTGIRLGAEYPGAAHTALQRTLLDLYARGIILAIASKNNQADAMEALENHPGMLLRPHHFAALRINWNDKAQSLREIAQELNIGVDALAFLDDNPVERERVRVQLPEVTVLELPEDPMGYAQAVRDCPVFERLTLSAEDRERGRYYAEQRQRAELEQSATSLEDFYRSLEMTVTIGAVTPETLARVAQLTQKTNQFNLTTRRYSEQEMEAKILSPDWRVYQVGVRDRFGDNGLVGVALLHLHGATWEIDTFLLSCRVIGRTVETAILSHLVAEARAGGAKRLQGWFFPTKKNAPSQAFYPSHRFAALETQEENILWAFDLETDTIECPEWMELRGGSRQ